ncbi:MAG: hypothetical protein ACI909_000892 [Planctomycetota bacterium]|jgi:uncharacterized protein with NRDE domain
MCLIIVAYKIHPQYPLVLAANRDEMYKRPSRTAHFWPKHPNILAGQDIEHGGSWLGLDKYGRIAALTNYRGGSKEKTGIASRGLLVSNFLQNQSSSINYIAQCQAKISDFDGFNLLIGDLDALYFLSSREQHYSPLQAGIYGISNGDLDSPWPKVEWAKQQLSTLLQSGQAEDHEAILALLADKHLPVDESLPDTGIDMEWERILAPVFIRAKDYGTRASTVITIDNKDKVTFSERTYDGHGEQEKHSRYEFTIVKEE